MSAKPTQAQEELVSRIHARLESIVADVPAVERLNLSDGAEGAVPLRLDALFARRLDADSWVGGVHLMDQLRLWIARGHYEMKVKRYNMTRRERSH